MPYHSATIVRGTIEIEIDVDFNITHYGCGSNCWDEPGEAPEVEIEKVSSKHAGLIIELTTLEDEQICRDICAIEDYFDRDPFDD